MPQSEEGHESDERDPGRDGGYKSATRSFLEKERWGANLRGKARRPRIERKRLNSRKGGEFGPIEHVFNVGDDLRKESKAIRRPTRESPT